MTPQISHSKIPNLQGFVTNCLNAGFTIFIHVNHNHGFRESNFNGYFSRPRHQTYCLQDGELEEEGVLEEHVLVCSCRMYGDILGKMITKVWWQGTCLCLSAHALHERSLSAHAYALSKTKKTLEKEKELIRTGCSDKSKQFTVLYEYRVEKKKWRFLLNLHLLAFRFFS